MMRTSFLVLATAFLFCLSALPVSAQPTPDANPPLYAPEGIARLISMSPDGSMVVGTQELSNDTLCTYAVRTGVEIACADLTAQQILIDFQDAVWSPDSSTVAFAELTWSGYKDGDLWSMNATTGALTNLTDDGYLGKLPFNTTVDFAGSIYADVLPRWSPDGEQIAFSRTSFLPDGSTPSELWVLDIATGESRLVTQVSDHELALLFYGIAWSADGQTIYGSLAHRDEHDPGNGVWSFDVATGSSLQIAAATADFNDTAPAVMNASPDGQWLTLFYPRLLSESIAADQSGYALLELATGDITPILAPADIAGALPAPTILPGFTPDGETLVYGVRRYSDGMGLVQVRNLATGAEETIATTIGGVFPTPIGYGAGMVVSPDGLVFVPVSLTTGLLVSMS
jgi:dipeptidyl aminopeptidase/acylaminoacyl peptidase